MFFIVVALLFSVISNFNIKLNGSRNSNQQPEQSVVLDHVPRSPVCSDGRCVVSSVVLTSKEKVRYPN
jgi:hypothetical protein